LLAAAFLSWDHDYKPLISVHPIWVAWVPPAASALIAWTLLVVDRTIPALSLFGLALIVSGVSLSNSEVWSLRHPPEGEQERVLLARRVAAGLKYVALAAAGTGLLVVGAVMLDHYALNLEKRTVLQIGVNLLSVGLIVRAGA